MPTIHFNWKVKNTCCLAIIGLGSLTNSKIYFIGTHFSAIKEECGHSECKTAMRAKMEINFV